MFLIILGYGVSMFLIQRVLSLLGIGRRRASTYNTRPRRRF